MGWTGSSAFATVCLLMSGTMQSFVRCAVLPVTALFSSSVAALRSVLLRHLVVRFLVELDKIRKLFCVDIVPLRYHASVQVVSAAWLAFVFFVSTHVCSSSYIHKPPTASLRRGTNVPCVSLPGPTSVPSDAEGGIEGRAPTLCGWCCCVVVVVVVVRLFASLTCVLEHLHESSFILFTPSCHAPAGDPRGAKKYTFTTTLT